MHDDRLFAKFYLQYNFQLRIRDCRQLFIKFRKCFISIFLSYKNGCTSQEGLQKSSMN